MFWKHSLCNKNSENKLKQLLKDFCSVKEYVNVQKLRYCLTVSQRKFAQTMLCLKIMVNMADIFNDTHREKLCFTQFNTRIYLNRSLAASDLLHMFRGHSRKTFDKASIFRPPAPPSCNTVLIQETPFPSPEHSTYL